MWHRRELLSPDIIGVTGAYCRYDELTICIPTETTGRLVTGLGPVGGYSIDSDVGGSEIVVMIHPGKTGTADEGVVLVVDVET